MDPDSIWLYLGLLFLLIVINAFFAMSELAVITLNDAKVLRMAEEGNKKARLIAKLIKEPSKFLSAIQVGVTLSGLLASAVAADKFAALLVNSLAFLPVPTSVLRGVSLVVITILLSYFTLVFGELVPKRFAMCFPEKIAFAVAPALWVICRVEAPFVWLLSKSTNAVVRLTGVNPDSEQERVTEEEIRMMVDVGSEKGVIEPGEKDMIDNIFEFDDRTAGEVMTHRTEMTAIEDTMTVREAVAAAVEDGYSRIPVYTDDIDSICGILYVKDLLPLISANDADTVAITGYLRPALFVPESNSCTELMRMFKERKTQMAVVVDEYGGTAGIVTMEDLLEAIVGNIQDEYDDEEEEISRQADGTYLIDGTTAIEDVEKLLRVELQGEEDYDTLGGLILDILERIPGEEDYPQVTVGPVTFTVERMEERRIDLVRAKMEEDVPKGQE